MSRFQQLLGELLQLGGVRRDLLIALLGFALGAGATFLVWRQHAEIAISDTAGNGASAKLHLATRIEPTIAPPPSIARTPAANLKVTPAVADGASISAAQPSVSSAAPAASSPVAAAEQVAREAVATAGMPLEISVDNLFDGTGYNGTWHQRMRAGADTQVTYRLERRNDRLTIAPTSALYLASRGERPLPSAGSAAEALQWQLPRLTLKLENKSAKLLAVSALELSVRRSEGKASALVFVPSAAGSSLELENVGWGKALRPELSVAFAPAQQFDSVQPASAAAAEVLKLEDFDERLRVDLRERVPAALRASGAAAYGVLSYTTETGEKLSLPFKSLVSLNRAAAPRRWRPLFFHHVLLKAGQLGVTTLPVAAKVAPGKTFESKLRIASDRSSRQEILLTLKAADGAAVASQLLDLEIFVPRFDANAIVRTTSTLRATVQ